MKKSIKKILVIFFIIQIFVNNHSPLLLLASEIINATEKEIIEELNYINKEILKTKREIEEVIEIIENILEISEIIYEIDIRTLIIETEDGYFGISPQIILLIPGALKLIGWSKKLFKAYNIATTARRFYTQRLSPQETFQINARVRDSLVSGYEFSEEALLQGVDRFVNNITEVQALDWLFAYDYATQNGGSISLSNEDLIRLGIPNAVNESMSILGNNLLRLAPISVLNGHQALNMNQFNNFLHGIGMFGRGVIEHPNHFGYVLNRTNEKLIRNNLTTLLVSSISFLFHDPNIWWDSGLNQTYQVTIIHESPLPFIGIGQAIETLGVIGAYSRINIPNINFNDWNNVMGWTNGIIMPDFITSQNTTIPLPSGSVLVDRHTRSFNIVNATHNATGATRFTFPTTRASTFPIEVGIPSLIEETGIHIPNISSDFGIGLFPNSVLTQTLPYQPISIPWPTNVDLSEIQMRLSAIEGVQQGVIEWIESQAEEMSIIRTVIGNTMDRIFDIDLGLEIFNTRILDIDNSLILHHMRLLDIDQSLEIFNSNLLNIDYGLELHQTHLLNIDTLIDSMTGTLSNLGSQVGAIEGSVSGSISRLGELESSLTGTNIRIGTLEDGIASLGTIVGDITNTLTNVNDRIADLESLSSVNTGFLSNILTSIQELTNFNITMPRVNFDMFLNFNITERFPFSLPWDFMHILNELTRIAPSQAGAPIFVIDLTGTFIGQTYTVDMNNFETLASAVRTLQRIAFSVFLIFVTAKFFS